MEEEKKYTALEVFKRYNAKREADNSAENEQKLNDSDEAALTKYLKVRMDELEFPFYIEKSGIDGLGLNFPDNAWETIRRILYSWNYGYHRSSLNVRFWTDFVAGEEFNTFLKYEGKEISLKIGEPKLKISLGNGL